MFRRTLFFSLLTFLMFTTTSMKAQVPEGTVLVQAHDDVMVLTNMDPRLKVMPAMTMFSADIVAVFHDGKYQFPDRCNDKEMGRLYGDQNNKRLTLLRNGSAFASGRLVSHSSTSGKRTRYALTVEDLRPSATTLSALGATSDKVGTGKRSDSRKVTTDERAKWEAVAKSILRDGKKIPEAELKDVEHERVTIINVDGKSPLIAGELITKGADGFAHQLLLIAEANGNELKPVLAQYNRGPLVHPSETRRATFPYLDALDVDGDGNDEIVALLTLSGNRIFHRDGARWAVAYSSNPASECPATK